MEMAFGRRRYARPMNEIMKNATKFLQNLIYRGGYLKTTIKEGVAALKPYAKALEVVHIKIDYPAPSIVFYILSKKTKIPHFLLKYNSFNEFECIGRRYRIVLTPGFGSNFNLDKRLEKEIRGKGLYWK